MSKQQQTATRTDLIKTLFTRGHYCEAYNLLHWGFGADLILTSVMLERGQYPDLRDFTNSAVYGFSVQSSGAYGTTPEQCRVEVQKYLANK